MSDTEFSVYVFFPDGSYKAEARFMGAEVAVKLAHRLIGSVAGRIGTLSRVIITDGVDDTVFVWEFGKGVTFPPRVEEE